MACPAQVTDVLTAYHVQEEKVDESGWREPPGFHLIPLPFADDIRAAPVEKAFRGEHRLLLMASHGLTGPFDQFLALSGRYLTHTPFFHSVHEIDGRPSLGRRVAASDELKDAARAWIDKLNVKNGSYPPDSYPNPGEQPDVFPLDRPFCRALTLTARIPMLPFQLLHITTPSSKPAPSAKISTPKPLRT